MPGRWVSAAIVAFWLIMMGWLAFDEVRQRYGAPPRLQDTLAASVADQRDSTSRWIIRQDDSPIGWATTDVRTHHRYGHYLMRQTVHLDRIPGVAELLQVSGMGEQFGLHGSPALDLKHRMEVTLFGELMMFDLHATLSPPTAEAHRRMGDAAAGITAWSNQGIGAPLAGMPLGVLGNQPMQLIEPPGQLICHLKGNPQRGGVMKLHAVVAIRQRGNSVNLIDEDRQFKYDGKDLLLNGLCPLDRMPNLRPGQVWESPLLDPIDTVLQSLSQTDALEPVPSRPAIKVRVLNEPKGLIWGSELVSCLVVESESAGVNLQIWVRESDGLVLQQNALMGTTTLAVVRESSSAATAPQER